MNYLHAVKCFQVLLFKTNNSANIIIIPNKRLNSSILPIGGTLTGTTTPGQSGPGSNLNEGVLNILCG